MAPVTPAISKKTSDKRFSNGLCIIKSGYAVSPPTSPDQPYQKTGEETVCY
jgi:hypothetical protein